MNERWCLGSWLSWIVAVFGRFDGFGIWPWSLSIGLRRRGVLLSCSVHTGGGKHWKGDRVVWPAVENLFVVSRCKRAELGKSA